MQESNEKNCWNQNKSWKQIMELRIASYNPEQRLQLNCKISTIGTKQIYWSDENQELV